MSSDHHLHSAVMSIARPSGERDWSYNIALGIAGFFGLLAIVHLGLPVIVRDQFAANDLSDQTHIGTCLLAFAIAWLLSWPRSRAFWVMPGAAAIAAGTFLLRFETRFAALPVALAVLIATAVRIDRLHGTPRMRADRHQLGRRA